MHCGSEVIYRFRVCGSFDSLLRGKLQVSDRLGEVAAEAIVMSQFAAVILQRGGIGSLDRVSYFEMKPLPPRRRQAADHRLASKLVGELKPGLRTFRDRENQSRLFGFLDALQNFFRAEFDSATLARALRF